MYKDTEKLPLNCQAEYTKGFLSKEDSNQLYGALINEHGIENLKMEIRVGEESTYSDTGKIMFIDQDLYETNKFPKAFWGETKVWPEDFKRLKEKVEKFVGRVFQICVCIYYPNGHSGVDFHSDYVAFGDTSFIPSISLGEEREFHLRAKEGQEVYKTVLEEGSLLLMGENCQERYEHSLPINPKYQNGRINLTFRPYGFGG